MNGGAAPCIRVKPSVGNENVWYKEASCTAKKNIADMSTSNLRADHDIHRARHRRQTTTPPRCCIDFRVEMHRGETLGGAYSGKARTKPR